MTDGTAAPYEILNVRYRCRVAIGIEVKGRGRLGLEMYS
jgi:hypothetical protein